MSQITVTNIQGQTSGGNANKVIITSGHTLEVTSNSTVGGSLTAPDIRGTAIKSSNGTAAMTIASGGQVTFATNPAGITVNTINEVADRTATTSGTSFDFTIPANTRRITCLMRGISLSGTDIVMFRLGTTGGITTSGYRGVSSNDAGNSYYYSNYGEGFLVDTGNSADASDSRHGVFTITHMGNNIFIGAGNSCRGADGQEFNNVSSGKVELAGACTTLRLMASGSNSFDAGEITVLTE